MKIAIAGASGRMGIQVVRAVINNPKMQLSQALVSSQGNVVGKDIGELVGMGTVGILCSNKLSLDFDVLIDFSTPQATINNIDILRNSTKAIVICTTGFDTDQNNRIIEASKHTPIIKASNTSLGITLLIQLVRIAASKLGDADIEIIEAHHRNKKDAPSGTAITIGEEVAKAKSTTLADAIYQRHGNTGERPRGPIGFATIRGGDIVGDHTVLLALEHEVLEISHRAGNRALFAHGALKAAEWIINQPEGRLYTMEDVVNGLSD